MMKSILISIILLVTLCFPAMSQDAPGPEGGQQAAIENLEKKLDEARTYSNSHNYAEAAKIIQGAVDAAEPILGATHDDIRTGKIFLAIAYIHDSKHENAYDILRHTLANSRRDNKGDDELATEIKALLINTVFTAGKHVEESPLVDEVLTGYVTYYPIEEQPIVFFQHATIAAYNDKLEKAAFFAKIWIGMESFLLHSNSEYISVLDISGIVEEMHTKLHMPIDKEAIADLLKSPNNFGDAPYNKAHVLMSKQENHLYRSFSLFASSLNNAGKEKDKSELKKYSRFFQIWLSQVNRRLY